MLLRANTSASEPIPEEGVEKCRMAERRKRASIILYSQVNSVAPNITATAAYARAHRHIRHRESLPTEIVRRLQLNGEKTDELEDMTSMSRYELLKRAVTAPIDYGTLDEADDDTMDETNENVEE